MYNKNNCKKKLLKRLFYNRRGKFNKTSGVHSVKNNKTGLSELIQRFRDEWWVESLWEFILEMAIMAKGGVK